MFMPNPAAFSAMERPMRPKPRMPSVAPRVRCMGWSRVTFAQPPALTWASCWPRRRFRARIMPRAWSVTSSMQ